MVGEKELGSQLVRVSNRSSKVHLGSGVGPQLLSFPSALRFSGPHSLHTSFHGEFVTSRDFAT